MATDTQDYEGVGTGEEEAWNPKKPQASALSDYVGADPAMPHSAQMEAPAVESAPLGAAPPIAQVGDKQPALPQRPQSPTKEEYAAVQPHGWKKALAATFAGMGAFESPEAGQQIYDREFGAPQRKLTQQSKEQQSDYDTELKQGQEQQAAQRASAMTTVSDAHGNMFQLPTKDIGKWLENKNTVEGAGARNAKTNETRENIADSGNETKEDIAGAGNTSKEKIAEGKNKTQKEIAAERAAYLQNIAKGHDLTSTEVAKIRAASADDPNKLTNTMKTMKQQAQSTLPGIDRALDETEKIAAKLGPAEGRWNDFWTGKIGADDPEYKHYKDEIGMVTSAVTLAHARGRMSGELYDHFMNMFDAGKQSPENMIQALNVGKEWLGEYANMGEPGSPVGNKQPAKAAPASGAPAPPKVGEVIDGHKFLGGDPRDKASWEKAKGGGL